MSKMDNLRAMREARYEQAQKRGAAAKPAAKSTGKAAARPPVAPETATPKKAAARTKTATSAKAASASGPETGAEATSEELCGHRNMSGRTCTRERGHAAKSHRYS